MSVKIPLAAGKAVAMMAREQAEAVALEALGWLAADDELVGGFLGATGLDAGDLRAAAGSPEFLGAVLDFILADDATVVAFAAQAGLKPEQVMAVRAALPGGDAPHWT